MINQVTKKECMEALDYLHGWGMVEELGKDKRHYVEILIKKVANIYNINLGGKSIICPNCKTEHTVYHFDWSAIRCNVCKKDVQKLDFYIKPSKIK